MSPPTAGSTTMVNSSKLRLLHHGMNVRFGSKADICVATSDVCFTPDSDRKSGHVPMACLLYSRKQTCAVQLAMLAMGQKRTSANKLRNLFFMGRAANPSTLPRLGWRSVAASTGRCHRAPSPRASDGGRSRQSPLECSHRWALSSAYFVAFIGRFIHGNEVSPGNLCREPAAVA